MKKLICLFPIFILLLNSNKFCFASGLSTAVDYATRHWICNQKNSDRGQYTDSDGVVHSTNPDGHPEYLEKGKACDYRAIFGWDGVAYGWGHGDSVDEFINNLKAPYYKGAGSHEKHGATVQSWSSS